MTKFWQCDFMGCEKMADGFIEVRYDEDRDTTDIYSCYEHEGDTWDYLSDKVEAAGESVTFRWYDAHKAEFRSDL